jgi:RNase P subunit RPR2
MLTAGVRICLRCVLLLLPLRHCRCRQKTLEDHVTCTNECCGNGRRMPLSFW